MFHRMIAVSDCYDQSLEFGSENPADPAKTTRVLTIMLAEECRRAVVGRAGIVRPCAPDWWKPPFRQ